MTRQAEPLTIEIEGEEAVCAPTQHLARASFLASTEGRLVLPEELTRWYASERLKVASYLARLLHLTTGPMPISTALSLAVRLSLRGGELRRKWCAFSVIEERFLRTVRLPDAIIEPGLVDGAVRFTFSRDEMPLETTGPLAVVPCEALSPLHCYRKRDGAPRELRLKAGMRGC